MEFGIALTVSGIGVVVGALCGSSWGEAQSYAGFYGTGAGLIALGLTTCFVALTGVTSSGRSRSIGSSAVTPGRLKFVILISAFAALTVWSSATGTPHANHVESLPAIALGSRLLFHVERAAAILALVGVVVLVGWRGAHGEWPIKFGNVEYAPKEAVKVTADALAKQDKRLRRLEDRVPRTAGAATGRLANYDARLRRLEDRVPRTAEVAAEALAKQDQRLRLLEERIDAVERPTQTD